MILFFCCFLWLQILDLAVSLAKVADVDRSLGNEDVAVNSFQEAIKLVEPLKLKPEESGLEQRVRPLLMSKISHSCILEPENLFDFLF